MDSWHYWEIILHYARIYYILALREEELNKIFEKYGYYFEYGNAWNLSAYDI